MTPTDITVTGEDFVSVNEVAGVPVGTALELQTKCASAVIVQRKEGKPSATDDNGRVMKSVKNASSIYQVREGSEEVWLRLNTDNFESEGKVGVYLAVEDEGEVAEPFTPLDLFGNGEDGIWLDPSDLSTLYQDSAMTIPVTSDGDPVGLILDKSGNGNHATQPAGSSRPIYRTKGTLHWLEFDGDNDSVSFGGISTIDSSNISMGVNRLSKSRLILLYSGVDPFLGAAQEAAPFAVLDSGSGSPSYYANGNPVDGNREALYEALPENTPVVIDVAGASLDGYVSPAIGDYGSYELSGNIYGVVITESLSESDTVKLREYTALKSGVVL